MQDVSDKLLGQFVACLEERLSGDGGSAEPGREPEADAPPAAAPTPEASTPSAPPPAAPADDAIDLGATVLPVLAKTYWKPALAVVLALLVLRRLLGR
jgi:hypothetical protein